MSHRGGYSKGQWWHPTWWLLLQIVLLHQSEARHDSICCPSGHLGGVGPCCPYFSGCLGLSHVPITRPESTSSYSLREVESWRERGHTGEFDTHVLCQVWPFPLVGYQSQWPAWEFEQKSLQLWKVSEKPDCPVDWIGGCHSKRIVKVFIGYALELTW